MKSNFKKAMSIALACTMFLVLCLTGLNISTLASAEDGTTYFIQKEDGTFCENSYIGYSVFSPNKLIPVKMMDSDIAQIVDTDQYLMRYAEDNYVLANKLTFSSANIDELSTASLQNGTKETMLNLLSESNGHEVVTYSMGSPYVGFAGKTYMDEIVFLNGKDERDISTNRFEQILENTVIVLVEGAVSTSAIGALTILLKNIFSDGSLGSTTQTTYRVLLSEDKYVKLCYMRDDSLGVYTSKAHTEKGVCKIQHLLTKIPDGYLLSPVESHFTKETRNYSSADKLAFENSGMGGFTERITSYKYKYTDKNDNVITEVNFESKFAY